MNMSAQPWLRSFRLDVLFILLPPLLPVVLVVLFQGYFSSHVEVNAWWWILLVLNIDVAHVYSTLFRFYWDKETYRKNKHLLVIIPIVAFGCGVLLHLAGTMVFWRTIAYLAVFHFVRQQYGFMRLYTRKETPSRARRILDNLAIYSATIYPIIYWHFYLTGELHWFVEGDFFSLPNQAAVLFEAAYWLILLVYGVVEVWTAVRSGQFNLPKNLLMVGTYLSWHLGIITFHGDLAFTLLNVVAHGIPYMALVYFFSAGKSEAPKVPWKGIVTFVFTVMLLAYLEEGVWDGLVWRDHLNVFPFFTSLPITTDHVLLSILVPLLALPQITHYVLDGYIWKVRGTKELSAT